jgi:hypothetical protein
LRFAFPVPLLVVALSLAACARHSLPTLPVPGRGVTVYDGRVIIDPQARSLEASFGIAFERSAADSITLLLNRGLTVKSVTGSVVSRVEEREADGLKRLTVHLAPQAAATIAAIDIAYAGVPQFSEDGINRLTAEWVELGLDSFWHPVFADFAHSIVARLEIELPQGWKVATSGTVSVTGGGVQITNTVPLIDIAFAASPALASRDAESVSVYYAGAEPAVAPKVITTTQSCAGYLNARYGSSGRLPHVKMVLAPRDGPGYARKNYIVVSRVADTADVALKRFVCHELAHFWSSGAVSSGPENWLNEAFAEFISARYVRATTGDSAYASIVKRWQDRAGPGPIWTEGSSRRPSGPAAYSRAPHLLHRMEARLGTAVMERILVRYMTEPLRTTPALLRMIEEVAGTESAGWFRSELALAS